MTSARTRRNFQLAWMTACAVVVVLWLSFGIDLLLDHALREYGVRPRSPEGMVGVLAAPFLHGSFGHLFSNSLPLAVLLTGALFLYPNSTARALPAIYIGTGLLVWLFARPANHIGASGVLYGLLAYTLVAGLLRRDARSISFSLLVYFLYGGMAWGLLPIKVDVSWESHVAGAVLGTLLAWLFRRWDAVPLKRYSWDDEDEDDDLPEFSDPDDRP